MPSPIRCVLACLLLATWFLPLPNARAQKRLRLPEGVELLRDVEYGTGGKRALKMHILRPKTPPKEALPVIVWIHGGGWQAGSRDSGIGILALFVTRGYLCASIEYRLSKEAIFPAQIHDCKCAIRFLRAKAKAYHLDPDRIGVWGSSAGADVTMHVVKGGTHGSIFTREVADGMVTDFFAKHLKPGKRTTETNDKK
jgi:acetyl esterase/lipase